MRKYDNKIGRFTSPDVLWQVTKGWSPYMYSFNNPIGFMDGNGYLPGDAFKSWDQAAHDFGKIYGRLSIIKNKELTSIIYKTTINDESTFSYTVPLLCNEINGGYINEKTSGEYKTIHAHGAYNRSEELPDVFSWRDEQSMKYRGVDGYIVTNGGWLMRWNLIPDKNGNHVKIVTDDMPIDKRNPKSNETANKKKVNYLETRPIPYRDASDNDKLKFWDINGNER